MTRLLIVLAVLINGYHSSIDMSYNCHNYAWETERRWLNDPACYIDAAIECDEEDATHVVYYDGDTAIHSSLYHGNGWTTGKWGCYPKITHPVHFSPYGHDVRYYHN